MNHSTRRIPAAFANAAAQVRGARIRRELNAQEIPAPERIAPHSLALGAGVVGGSKHPSDSAIESPNGAGRFVLMYDPESADDWGGPFRIVCFAQAPLEMEIGVDPFIAEVVQSWLVDALDTRAADYDSLSGTVTKTISSSFGEIAARGDTAQVELRASWTPHGDSFDTHVEAWAELLCLLAGLPHEGVESLEAKRIRNTRSGAS